MLLLPPESEPLTAEQWVALTSALSHSDPREGLACVLRLRPESAEHARLFDAAAESLRRRIEEREELHAVRERLELLSEASFEGLFANVGGEVLFANARMAQMLGTTVEAFCAPGTIARYVAPQDIPTVAEKIATQSEGAYLVTAIREDGSSFVAELQAKQTTFRGDPVRIVAVRDVTERERQASLLRESEERLRMLAKSAFDVLVISSEATVVDVGGTIEALLGYTGEELVGRPLFDVVAPSAQAHSRAAVQSERTAPFETLLVSKSGELVPVEIVAAYATLDGQRVRLAGLRDLRPAKRAEAERLRLHARIERGQRLEALGVLAGGIAHDFNNLLVSVITNAELLSLGEGLSDRRRHAADAILAAGQRAAALTQKVLGYAGRRSAPLNEPVDVGELVRDLRTMLAGRLSSSAELRLDLAEDCVISGDRATLSQIFMNLLTNASDALEGTPGRIQVRTQRVNVPDERWADALGAPVGPGDWVQVSVSDDGLGMDATTRARIFEPFFSTKETGHGLGLAGCLGILRTHGGAVLVESEPGQGSSFHVLLPASAEQPRSVEPAPRVEGVEPCAVLFVDDDPMVCEHVTRLLALRGFEVSAVSSGMDALARLDAGGIDLVIMDFKMPGMTGLEVTRRVRERGHAVPILLSSGYYDADLESLIDEGVIQGFLAKPYSLSALVHAISQSRTSTATG